jgi:DNA polymerase-3 subunit gamma/tau
MTIEGIVNHLRNIAEKENITVEEDALHVIAQKSDGGMRDALSMFERLVSFANGNLTYTSVLENLNVLDLIISFNSLKPWLVQDFSRAMEFF